MKLRLDKNIKNILKKITISVIIFAWIFSGWSFLDIGLNWPPELDVVYAKVESLEVHDKVVDFTFTDDNTDENLIIKTDKKTYIGLSRGEVYFSVTNISDRAESINLQVYFPHDNGDVKQIAKWTENIPYEISVPEYDVVSYFCEEGWQKDVELVEENSNQYKCYSTDIIKNCDEFGESSVDCIVNQVQVGYHQEDRQKSDWQNISLSKDALPDKSGFLKKVFKKEIDKKIIPKDLKIKKSSKGKSHRIGSNETQYFKMDIEFLPNSSGEFYIEAIGDKGGYGLLDPWWSGSWEKRKTITIDYTKVEGDLSDFPVLIDLSSDADLAADAQESGNDIAFTSSADVQLDHEIEYFNSTTGELQAWVKVPALSSSTSTVVYMYYGNSTCDSQENITGVWDSNHKLVHHLKDGATTTVEDSTSNNNDGTKKTATEPIETTSGQIAQAQIFDGSNDYVKITNNVTPTPISLTISGWIKKESGGSSYECALHKGSSATIGSTDYWLGVDISDKLTATIGANTGVGWSAGQTTSVVTYGTWYHLAASWDGTVVKVYIDGEYNKQYNLSSYGNNITPTRFGASSDGSNYQFKGVVDEIRISDTSRGADWIKTSYTNQNLPASFYALGSEEDAPVIEKLKQVHYHWRNDGGSETVATSATGGVEDTSLSLKTGDQKRLRIEISNEGTADSSGTTYRLEYGEKINTCSDISSWVDVGGSGGDWDMSDSTYLTDGNNTTNIAPSSGGMTDENTTFETPNMAIKDTSSQTASISLATTEFLEAEYSIVANSSATGKNYCFRLTNAGSITNFSYDVYPEINVPIVEQVHYRWRNDDGGEGDASSVWYDDSWSYRKKIIIDHTKVEGDHSDFPVLIHIDSSETDFWSHCSGKSEVVFTQDDGETKLKREIETFDHVGDDLYAWVKIPTMDKDEDLEIFLYYGNGSASETDDTDTWSNDYKLVYHLQETTGSSMDATANNYDGTTYGGVDQDVVGKISGADSFDGVSGTYTDTMMGYNLSGNGAFSVFTWIKDISNGLQYLMTQSHAVSYSSDWILGYQNNGLWFRTKTIDGGDLLGDGDWHYYGFIFDGINAELYVDGVQQGSSIAPTGYGAVDTIKLMTRGDGTSAFESGSLDEIHISNTDRSEAWVETSYNNQNSPADFYSIGNEQGETGATWAVNEDTALTGLTKITPRRLRIGISNEGNPIVNNYQYRLEVSEPNPNTCLTGSYERVSTDSDWAMVTSSYITEGQSTGDTIPGLSNENTTFVAGEVREVSDQTDAISLTSAEFTELEYSVQATASATGGATYCFRLTNAGSDDNFDYSESTYGKVTLSSVISISLNTDGSVAFNFLELDTTEDTSATGINDIEVVKIDSGPVDLDIRSSVFTEGDNTWVLGTTNGSNQVKWEFSPDGSVWTTFVSPDTLYPLATNIAEAGTQNNYLRITMPTVTDSYLEYDTTVTIVASAP